MPSAMLFSAKRDTWFNSLTVLNCNFSDPPPESNGFIVFDSINFTIEGALMQNMSFYGDKPAGFLILRNYQSVTLNNVLRDSVVFQSSGKHLIWVLPILNLRVDSFNLSNSWGDKSILLMIQPYQTKVAFSGVTFMNNTFLQGSLALSMTISDGAGISSAPLSGVTFMDNKFLQGSTFLYMDIRVGGGISTEATFIDLGFSDLTFTTNQFEGSAVIEIPLQKASFPCVERIRLNVSNSTFVNNTFNLSSVLSIEDTHHGNN